QVDGTTLKSKVANTYGNANTAGSEISAAINSLDAAIGTRSGYTTGGFLADNDNVTTSLGKLNNASIKTLALGTDGKITATRVDGTTTDLVTDAIHDYKIDSVAYDKTNKKLTITEKDAYGNGADNVKEVTGLDTSRVVAADSGETQTIYGGATTTIAGGETTGTSKKNITTKVTGDGTNATVEVALNKDITLDSVMAGSSTENTTISNTGVAVTGSGTTASLTSQKLTVGGKDFIDTTNSAAYINANNTKIINVASGGELVSGGTNAANIGDVYTATMITTSGNYYDGSETPVSAINAIALLDTELAKGFAVSDSTTGTANVKFGDTLKVVSSDGSITATVDGTTKTIGLVVNGSAITVEKAKKLDDKEVTEDTTAGTTTTKETKADKDGITVTTEVKETGGSVISTDTTTVTSDGVTVGDGTNSATLAKDGLNVTDGTNTSTYAAGGVTTTDTSGNSYTQTASSVILSDGTNTATITPAGYEAANATTTVKFTTDGISAGGQQITNVASGGTPSADNRNAANMSDLYSATTMTPAGNYYADKDSVTTAVSKVDAQVKVNADAIEAINNAETGILAQAKSYADTQDALTLASAKEYADENFAAKADVTNLGNTVTTLENTVSEHGSRIAAVEGEVSSLQTTVNNITSGSGEIKTQTVETKEFTVKDAGGETATVINEGGITTNNITVGDVVISEDGISAGGNKITDVADGTVAENSKDAVNGRQLYEQTHVNDGNYITETSTLARNVEAVDSVIGKLQSGSILEGNTVAADLKNLETAINDIEVGETEIAKGYKTEGDEAAKAVAAGATAVGYNTLADNNGATAAGYGNKVTGEMSTAVGYKNEVSGNRSGAFGDPNIVSGNGSYAIGNDNTIAGDNNFVLGNGVKIAKEVSNSVALGNGSTITESNVVSVGSAGAERRIANVADGVNPTDAATKGQVDTLAALTNQAIGEMQNRIGSVSGEVREVGAISAALAGLHYVEPTGEDGDKFVAAAAYGGYRGESATAVGVAYKPNPNFMVSASTSIGNSQNAYNAGISYKFGKGNTPATRASLQKQVKYVDEQNKALKEQNEAIVQQNSILSDQVTSLTRENSAIRDENTAQDEKLKSQDELIKKLLERVEKLERNGKIKPAETGNRQSGANLQKPVSDKNIQVMSSTIRSDSQRLADSLCAKGYNAFVGEGVVKGKTYYRCFVSGGDNPQATLAKLKKAGINGFIFK
ncbi:MAG: YadA-like family protein, partial [Synergistaceae bacterium]|nr:YadA-like family protein [Synergistaceae bacterium]